jgi:transposase
VKRKTYDKEFKEQAVKLVLGQGVSRTKAAKDLGIALSVLSSWVKDVQANGKDALPGKGKLRPNDEEVRRLERELKRVTTERDILKKAITFFRDEAR